MRGKQKHVEGFIWHITDQKEFDQHKEENCMNKQGRSYKLRDRLEEL